MLLVFDIGGTKIRIASSSDGENISDPIIFPTPQNFEEAIEQFKKIAFDLSNGQKIDKVAGGVRSPLDKEKSMFISNSILPSWINKPLKQQLEQNLNTEVYLENDAALVGLGEANFGAGKNKNIVAFITVSTGVGGARLVNKSIDKNALGFEPGHQIIFPDGNLCGCGGKGHLEAYISGSALEKMYSKKAQDITDPAVWDEIAKNLSISLNNTIVHWSPDIVVLGGSVMESIPLDKVSQYLQDFLKVFPTAPEITLATLGEKGGLYGALAYLKEQNI